MGNGIDQRSVGMCVGTIVLKIWSDINLNEVGAYVAIFAGMTTIAYNLYRLIKEIKQKWSSSSQKKMGGSQWRGSAVFYVLLCSA